MKTLLALVALLVWTASVAVGADIDNPEYKHWSAFKPGAFVKFKMVSEASGTKTELEQTVKLVDVSPAKAVVETVMIMGGNTLPAQKRDVPAKLKSAPVADAKTAKATKPTEGSEDLDVGGKKVKTNWVESTVETGGNKTIAKVWQAKGVPGGTVKMESRTTGAVTARTSMVATEWKD